MWIISGMRGIEPTRCESLVSQAGASSRFPWLRLLGDAARAEQKYLALLRQPPSGQSRACPLHLSWVGFAEPEPRRTTSEVRPSSPVLQELHRLMAFLHILPCHVESVTIGVDRALSLDRSFAEQGAAPGDVVRVVLGEPHGFFYSPNTPRMVRDHWKGAPDFAQRMFPHGRGFLRRGATAEQLSDLSAACAARDRRAVRKAILSGVSATEVDPEGWEPLHHAARQGDLAMVKLLTAEGGACPQRPTGTGLQPIHLAAHRGHLPILQWLVSIGVSPGALGKDDVQPLHLACQNGHLDAARYLVEECGVEAAVRGKSDWQSLHLAANDGQTDVCRYLVETCGVDPGAQDEQGTIALTYAARDGHRDTFGFLLGKYLQGVGRPTADDHVVSTCADVALSHGHDRLAAWIEMSWRARCKKSKATPRHDGAIQVSHSDACRADRMAEELLREELADTPPAKPKKRKQRRQRAEEPREVVAGRNRPPRPPRWY